MLKQHLNEKRVFGLDLMRSVAILMVLFAHCVWIFPEKDNLFQQVLALFGFLGVEIFFVLSGFLIGRILYRLFIQPDFRLRSIGYFLKRRWYRTLPNYFLILILNLVIAYLIGYEVENAWRYFVFLQNFASPMLPFFPESWSLSVEEFAYLIIPFALLPVGIIMGKKDKSNMFAIITLLLILMCISAKFLYHANTSNNTLQQWNISLKAVVIYRLDSIFIGVLFAWIYSRFHPFWARSKVFWAALGFMMMGFFTVGIGYFHLLIDAYPLFWNVFYLPAASLSIAFFLPWLSEWKTTAKGLAYPVTFISLISYSIYLLHYSIVLQSLKQLVATEGLSRPAMAAFTAGYILLTLFLSYLLYRFFEKPMMDLRD